MNWETIEGQWKKVRGQVKQRWAKFTDDDMMNLKGKREELVGRVQERYGCIKDEAERQVDEWIRSVSVKDDAHRTPQKRSPAMKT